MKTTAYRIPTAPADRSVSRLALAAIVVFTFALMPGSFSEGPISFTVRDVAPEDDCLPEYKSFDPKANSIRYSTNEWEFFISVFLKDDPVAEEPAVGMVIEFSNRQKGFGIGAAETWQSLLQCGVVDPPVSLHGITSTTDFAGPGDNAVYNFQSVATVLDANGNPTYAIQMLDREFSSFLALSSTQTHQILLRTGDTLPRAANLPQLGNTITEIDSPVISQTHVAVLAYGQGFSGVYAWSLTNPEPIITVVEDFSNITNEYGTINSIDFQDDDTLVFASGNGVFRVDVPYTNPPPRPFQFVRTGEYAPDKEFNNPSWVDVEGDRVVVQAFDENFRSAIFVANVSGGTVTPTYLVGAATPLPGEAGNFGSAQRPILSDRMIIFEGFKGFNYHGAFAYLFENNEIIPLVKSGDTIDGKKVKLAVFDHGSVVGDTVGLSLYYEDNISSAPYLFKLVTTGGNPQISLSAPTYSPTTGFSATFNTTVGTLYTIQYNDNPLSAGFVDLQQITATETGSITFTHSSSTGVVARFYRVIGILQ